MVNRSTTEAVRILQRFFRNSIAGSSRRRRRRTQNKILFILNPYDGDLNLADKGDRKLFVDGIKGIEESQRFDGKKEKFHDLLELIHQQFEQVSRLIEAFKISKEWTGTKPRGPSKVNNMLKTKGTDEWIITRHVDLIWANMPFYSADTKTPDYFNSFQTVPTKTEELNKFRNKRRFKRIMLEKQMWNSLTPKFQLELLTEKAKFKRSEDFDGVLLWYTLVNHMNPSAVISVGNVKDEIETAMMNKFEQNIKLFNLWFTDQRSIIVKEVGAAGYTEYLCCLFKTHITSTNTNFRALIKEQRKKWMMGELKAGHKSDGLMPYTLKLCNNQWALGKWDE
eukprot:15367190-Ditylum_brightwellii.AAC.5